MGSNISCIGKKKRVRRVVPLYGGGMGSSDSDLELRGSLASYYGPPPQPVKPRPLDRRYSQIADDYHSVDQVTDALAQAGLESSNLMVGIDFTNTNEWTGNFSFCGRRLHHTSNTPTPYEQAISSIGRTLSKFDEDNLIPCFGFGDGNDYTQYTVDLLALDLYSAPNPNPGSQAESALRLVLDSGASMHAVGDRSILQGYCPFPNPWLVAQPNGSFLRVVGVGTIAQGDRFIIPNVYHVEGLKKNLISVSKLAAQHGICFVNKRCEITLSDGTPVGGAFMEDEGNMYVLSYLQVPETQGRGLGFVLDSGAGNHMVGDPGLLRDIQYFDSPRWATQGDGSQLRILGVGTIKTEHFNVPSVQLVEGLTKNLISVGQLDSDHGTCSSFHGNVCKIMLPDGTVLGEAELAANGLYMLRSLQLPGSTPSQD